MSLAGLSGAEVNLMVQVTLLFLLLVGTQVMMRRRFRTHGKVMAAAIVLQVGALIFWMAPSFIIGIATFSRFDFGSLITIFHVILGYCTLFLSVSSALHKPLIGVGLKWTMRATLLIWLLTGILGIVFYLHYYILG